MASRAIEQSTDIPEVSFHNSASNFDLEVLELENIQQRSKELAPSPDTPHRIGFNLLLMVEQGRGAHLIDFERIDFSPGSILFINQGQVQAFDFSRKLKGKVIVYTEKFLDTLQANVNIPFSLSASMPRTFVPHIQLDSKVKRSVARLTEELNIEMSQPSTSLEIMMSLFSALVMLLARERKKSTNLDLQPSDIAKFMSFHKLIESYYSASREAGFYADRLGMTYKTLNLLSKKISGKTAKLYIDQHLILEAKRRLMVDQCDIATLAYDLGFKETTNFTKFFKRYANMTPHQFRQNVRY